MIRRGYTLVELIVVVSIMALLLGLSTPSVLSAIQRGRANTAAEQIVRAHATARKLAMTHHLAGPLVPTDAVASFGPASRHYGMRLVPDGGAYRIDVILATGPADPTLTTVASYRLPPYVRIRVAANPQTAPADLTAPLAWFYRYGSGDPIASLTAKDIHVPIDIGQPGWTSATDPNRPVSGSIASAWGAEAYGIKSPTTYPASPICGYLEVATRNGTSRRRVIIMRNGIAHAQEPTP